jgi:hypothetical protein
LPKNVLKHILIITYFSFPQQIGGSKLKSD